MKKVALLLVGATALLHSSAQAGGQPRGSVLELHSCELYAGGCIVSSEATQGGRYMLRVWTFRDGEVAGTPLAGLHLALLQASPDNLAAADSSPGRGVLYLPKTATAAQQAALVEWAKSAGMGDGNAHLQARVVPLELTRAEDGYRFSAGDYISVKTASLESCPTGSCGEALWYTPRTRGTIFTVAVNQSSRVSEPLLRLKWEDGGKKSVFLARFGEDVSAKNLYVSAVELCWVGRF
ncbi:MAG TPA: DUF1326 domain-containing protein [Verrucomicrobiae bacterium]